MALIVSLALGCGRKARTTEGHLVTPPDDAPHVSGPNADPPAATEPSEERRPGEYAMIPLGPSGGSTLVTKNYIVTVYHNCPEGCVCCDRLIYYGVSKKSGHTLVLRGSKLVSNGGLGHFQGYRFENGDTTYMIYAEGVLGIYQGNTHVLAHEEGVWLD
jgi:hypothetical protein